MEVDNILHFGLNYI